jgi:hypothetical protein
MIFCEVFSCVLPLIQIGSSIRAASKECLHSLRRRERRHTELVDYLRKVWATPVDRVRAVAESDPALASIIAKEKLPAGSRNVADAAAARASAADHVGGVSLADDTRSEFSRATMRSYVSDASIRSGMSTVSVLSNLSHLSNASSAVSDSSSFSIRGIEHAVLSRGGLSDSGKSMNQKQKKRHEKHQKGNKGGAHGGMDIHNLKGENSAATELCQYCDLSVVANAVADIRDALLLLGGASSADVASAMTLEKQMNEYCNFVANNPPPSAPLYPVDWLRRKSMNFLRCFQEWPKISGDSVVTLGDVNNKESTELLWWKVAAAGIIHWRKLTCEVLSF